MGSNLCQLKFNQPSDPLQSPLSLCRFLILATSGVMDDVEDLPPPSSGFRLNPLWHRASTCTSLLVTLGGGFAFQCCRLLKKAHPVPLPRGELTQAAGHMVKQLDARWLNIHLQIISIGRVGQGPGECNAAVAWGASCQHQVR